MKKLQEYTDHVVQGTKTLRQEYKRKEEELLVRIESLQNIKKKSGIDTIIKRSRDEALLELRKHKRIIDKLEREKKILKETETKLEQLLESKTSEIRTLIQSQNSVKQDLTQMLNQQNELHKEELEKKNKRISELEKLMMEKIRKD